ncbi:MAG: FHA domain-containing protein [Pseudomonadota bacterium]
MAKRKRPKPVRSSRSEVSSGGNGRSARGARLSDPVWSDGEPDPEQDDSLDIAPLVPGGRSARSPAAPSGVWAKPGDDVRPRMHSAAPAAAPAPSRRSSRAIQEQAPPDAVGVLSCVAGPEEGNDLMLTEGVFGIGRGRDNHFVLKDIAASRQHIELRVHQGEVLLLDLGSGNGTRLNGRRIQKAALRSGDRIEIGNSALTFTAFGGPRHNTGEISVVPPRPAPRPSDLWPETETLLAELEAYERHARRGGPAPSRPSAAPALQRQRVPAEAPPSRAPARMPPVDQAAQGKSLTEIREAIGAPGRFGSVGWLLGGAVIILVLLGIAGAVVYVTQLKNNRAEQARALVVGGHQALAVAKFDEARAQFEQAIALDATNDEAKKGLEILQRTRQSNAAFERALQLLEGKDYDGARHALEGVLADTPRFRDVEDARSRIDKAEASELVAQARTLFKGGQLADAEKILQKALNMVPEHSAGQALAKDIDKAKSTPLTPVQETPAENTPPKVEPERKKPPPVRKPRRRPRASSARMSDSEAKGLYRDALEAYKNDDRDRARTLLKRIINGTSSSSLYHEKARSFMIRKL